MSPPSSSSSCTLLFSLLFLVPLYFLLFVVLEASIDEKGRHRVVRALYPKRVALLTLFNHADKGGTRLTFKDGVRLSQITILLYYDLYTFSSCRNQLW